MEDEIEREYRRRLSARRRRMFCRRLCRGRPAARAHHYCIINATVPVLQRYFADEDTRPDFRLGREAIQQLLVALKTERQHGWGPTLETLVFLFWIASGSAYRVVSRVFDVPLPSVHRIVHRMVDEVVAVLPQFVRLPRVEDLQEPLALITPYKRPVRGMAEQRFNYHHSRGHSVIERAFWVLKTRFRSIFLEALEVHPKFVPKVVTACVILHNICVGVGDDLPPEDAALKEDNQPPAAHEGGGESERGAAWRTALVNEVSALAVAPLDYDYFAQCLALDCPLGWRQSGRGASPSQTALMPHPLGHTRAKSLLSVSRRQCPVLRRDTCIPEQ
ncbi:hypothetical protein F7725_025174 [Dissostichus mawsoni]|uniref:DDE Tnp4 domain-containing protein n=1 Tax=Dissostichus mawsoni TaxID=36200 RepID=A0A7J5XAD8_DISMA|nr:hypothetical protein F7725_025174 [Dissostichus mawsoni]